MLYTFGNCELDAARCELRCAGETVTVEPKVFKVLAYLLAHRDRVVTKDELLECFWPGAFMSESALTRCLTKARRAVHDDSVSQCVIKTVRGHGYRFIAAVAVRTSAPAAAPVSARPPEPTPPAPRATPVATNSPYTRSVVPGERKQVTVLVAGLKGVPALAQAVDAEVLYELLNRASTLMQEEIQRFDGLVIQGSGEHLTALFGAPMAHEDHTIRALHAALGLQQALVAYADELQRTRAMTLDVGVGMHTSSVVVGTSDNAARPGYSAQGFAIYLAERLQALATGGAICVSAAVQQQAAGFFRFDDRGACTLPDIAQPVYVYACTGVAQGTSRLEAFLHRYWSRFLGREHDMDLLGTLWARVRRGQGQVVLLFGEAGVGKSRLAYEFQRNLVEGRRLQAQTLSYGQSMSYHAMIPLLRTLLGLTDHDTPQQQRQHLRACLAAAQPPLAADEPLLAHLLGISLEPDQLPTLPPEEQKRRLQHACLQVILQYAAEQPLCLLIEDLHWLDNSSQELLDLVVTSSARQPVLLLGTARPGFRDTWADRSYFHRLTVEPLSDEHTDTFIHNYFRPYDASAALKALIRARTAGNPFFVEEMLRTLQEHALIVLQDGVYVLKPDAHLDIPASVHGVLAARIDRLPSEAKRLLQTAAVIGTEVPVAFLGAIAELSDEALHHGLAHLQAAEFLYETRRFPEQVYTFKHALTHEVAYTALLRDRRRALHARIVEAIETRSADRRTDQVESLAHHAFQGEVWDKAFTYLRQAGAQADALVALGVIECHGDQYQNGPVAAAFLSGKGPVDLRPFLRFWNHLSYPMWTRLEEAIRTVQGQGTMSLSGEQQRIFPEGVEAIQAAPAGALPTAYDFRRHRRVLDLGGGTGSWLIALLRHYPTLEGTLFDLPNAAAIAGQRLAGEFGTQRAQVVARDFFTDPIPGGHDAVLIANVIHLFSPAHNLELLRRTRAHVQDGARLLLADFWTDATHTQPPFAALMAGEFLVITGEGDVYSEEEARGWLQASGWRAVARQPLAGPVSLLVAETAKG